MDYNSMLHTGRQWWWKSCIRIWTHNRNPIYIWHCQCDLDRKEPRIDLDLIPHICVRLMSNGDLPLLSRLMVLVNILFPVDHVKYMSHANDTLTHTQISYQGSSLLPLTEILSCGKTLLTCLLAYLILGLGRNTASLPCAINMYCCPTWVALLSGLMVFVIIQVHVLWKMTWSFILR